MREISDSDIPLLPAKDFLKEYVLTDGDSVENLIKALRDEIEIAKKNLEKEKLPCEHEKIASVITLSAVLFTLKAVEELKNYEEGKSTNLDDALVALEGVLGLIRASGTKALPESVREVLEKCCSEGKGSN